MKRTLFLSAIILLLHSLLSPSVASGQGVSRPLLLPQKEYGDRPLLFEPNRGQAEEPVAFLAHGGDYTLFLTPQEVVFASRPRSAQTSKHMPGVDPRIRRAKRTRPATPDLLRMRLAGAKAQVTPFASGLESGNSNYLTGKDPAQWHTRIPNYARVTYPEVYPGIDLVYYGDQRRLEYDFVLRPHADPSAIGVRFAGAKSLKVDHTGALHLKMAHGELVWHRPVLYQEQNGERHAVTGAYRLCRDTGSGHAKTPLVRFEVGAYDPALPLVIDPSIAYSTLLGGNGGDIGRAIRVDAAGNAYVVGNTLSTNFPTTPGVAQRNFGGGGDDGDAFITKLDHNGQVVFTTYLGGTNSDSALAVALFGSTIYIGGETYSHDFPVTPTAFQTTPPMGNNTSVFVAALSGDGTSLLYSTYMGGVVQEFGGTENYVTDMTIDSQGFLYLTGYTDADFPTTPGALKTNGGLNAIVAKMDLTKSGAASVIFSTLLGGNQAGDYDEGDSIALDSAGNIYIAGYTYSFDYPTTPGAYQTSNFTSSGSVSFLTKLNPNATQILYSTYFNGAIRFGGLALDSANNAYVTGVTGSAFPTTTGALQTSGTSGAAFLTKFNATGTAILYSTYLGKGGRGYDLKIDPAGMVYVTGNTTDTAFPTTVGAYSRTFLGAGPGSDEVGGGDAFLTKIDPSNFSLVYSTYLGGAGDDCALGMAVDSYGDVYLTGATGAHTGGANFPVTTQATYAGGEFDAFVTKISTARLTGLSVNPTSGTGGTAAAPSLLTGSLTFDGLTAPSDTVALTSSNPAIASVNATAAAPEVTAATFPITLHPVATDTSVTISASFGGVTLTVPLTVLAPHIASVTLAPSSVTGGTSAAGTATLTGPAPTGGLTVTLNSGNAAVTVPATVTVPADATTATFTANTQAVPATIQTTITATSAADPVGKSGTLTVKAPDLSSLTFSPASVRGGQNSTGTVTISSAAPTAGLTINLSSGNASLVSSPATVTVAGGATTATFTVTTKGVAANTNATVTATLNSATTSGTLTLTPPDLTALSVSPASVKGGTSSTGTVTLSDPAGAGGIVVSLSSDKSAASVPATVTVPANSKTATFTVNTTAVGTDTTATLTASFNSQTQTTTLTIQSPQVLGLGLSPTTVRSLQSATATVYLDGPAPAGGTVVTLASANASVATLPATVTVPAGATSTPVKVTTGVVSADTRVLLAAAIGNSNASVTLTVQPHLPFDFDNDGHNDLLFQNQTTNLIVVWYANALQILGGNAVSYTPPAGWQVVGCADINHDGTPDLFLQNQTSGQINVWYMIGTAVSGGETLSMSPQGGYKVVGIGDFNGDGKPDLLFQNPTNGQLVIWYLDGAKVVGGVALPQMPASGYNVVGVGDFNGDGKPDIVFQNQTSNQIVIWYMNGSLFTGNGGATAYAPQSGWQVKAVEDINGDGKPDIIFQNQTTNQVLAWFMDGLNVLGGGLTSVTPDPGYKIQAPR